MPFEHSIMIHKEELKGACSVWHSLWLPSDTEFLSVNVQNGCVVMWYELGLMPHMEFRYIKVLTGQRAAPTDQQTPNEYVGTALLDQGSFVVHVYVNRPCRRYND